MSVTINGSNTPTAGGVTYGDGTNYATTAAGTSGQLLQSNGSSAPTWTTPSTGAMTLITTTTASSSANVLFTGLSSTYTNYMVVVSAAVPATNAVEFRCQLSTDGGSSYVTLHWLFSNFYYSGGFSADGGSNNYVRAANALSNTASNGGISGTIMLYNPSTTSAGKLIRADMTQFSTSGSPYGSGFSIASGNYQTSGLAINAVNFLFSSGNITSGTFKLYGIS